MISTHPNLGNGRLLGKVVKMMMKKFAKPETLLPVLSGVVVGIVLFLLGDAGDAPGLSLIGLVAAFLLIMWGVYNSGVLKKSFLLPILLMCFGAGGILLFVTLLLDRELENSPGMALIGVATGFVLLVVGAMRLRKVQGKG